MKPIQWGMLFEPMKDKRIIPVERIILFLFYRAGVQRVQPFGGL